MKERLIQLLDLEQLSPSKFADLIGVQRSSVSHVISGRNNPSFDFIQKTLRAFPGLNAEWLILGNGTMYEQMGRPTGATLFEAPEEQDKDLFPENLTDEGTDAELSEDSKVLEHEQKTITEFQEGPQNQEDIPGEIPSESHVERKVVQVMIFYEDNTFKTFTPAK